MVTVSPKGAAVLLLGAVTFCSPFLQTRRNQDVAQNPASTVARIDKTHRGVTIKVDSTPIGLTATNNLLYVLNRVHEERGANANVVVLVDPHVSITDLWNFEGVAGKAQLNNLRFFVINHESGVMAELKWGPTVPFSTNPN